MSARLTAMHHAHLAAGAVMVERDGWQLPGSFTSAEAEVETVRRAVGVCDVSPAGKLTIQGRDAPRRVAEAMPACGPVEVGLARTGPTGAQAEAGGEVSDSTWLTVLGLSHDEVMVLTAPSEVGAVAGFLGRRLEGCAHLVDVTSVRAGLWVAGPLGHRVLSRLAELDLEPAAFPVGACAQGKVAGVHAVVLRRDAAGLPAYQLYVTRDYGEHLWDAILHAGRGEGIAPFGTEALERLTSGR